MKSDKNEYTAKHAKFLAFTRISRVNFQDDQQLSHDLHSGTTLPRQNISALSPDTTAKFHVCKHLVRLIHLTDMRAIKIAW